MLVAAADYHGVEAWVHAAASAAHAPALAARLEPALLRAGLARTQTVSDLCVAASAFDGEAINWLTFKGPVLDEVIHQPPHMRAYGDLDLVVPARSMGRAVEVLEEAGGSVIDQNWTLLRRTCLGELHLRLPFGSLADLHWHFIGTTAERSRSRIDMAGVINRRRLVRVAGLDVPTMDAVDTLIHVSVHAAKHGGNRLLWLKDIEQCALREKPDWDLIVARCLEWRVNLPVATMLSRTRHVLGLAVPDQVFRSLKYRPAWSTLTVVVDRLAPTPRTRGGRSLAGMTAAATGSNQRESFVALAGRTARAVSHPRHMPPPSGSRDASDPTSPLYSTGGSVGRDEYLAAIANQA